MNDFVPLRVRSHGSLLEGVASPETLLERAASLGYRALAITDRNNLYLAIRFWQEARRLGLTPLLGAEIAHRDQAALLLPLDRRGYGRLCELLSQRGGQHKTFFQGLLGFSRAAVQAALDGFDQALGG